MIKKWNLRGERKFLPVSEEDDVAKLKSEVCSQQVEIRNHVNVET
ncbi:hypothetical protein [Chryseobacterium sp. HSC-36S06]|nr:hypothetical protein [Chryseobacterium sp. HSC-36S06]MCP2039013.1 hypothetical protein [Chryseobacterium sp. HSC-36S06]